MEIFITLIIGLIIGFIIGVVVDSESEGSETPTQQSKEDISSKYETKEDELETCEDFIFHIYREKEAAKTKKYAEYGFELDTPEDTERKINEIKENDNKGLLIFHGGCLQCQTPINDGISSCFGCKYFTKDLEHGEDKSTKE